jgi:hypothetical protein
MIMDHQLNLILEIANQVYLEKLLDFHVIDSITNVWDNVLHLLNKLSKQEHIMLLKYNKK